MTDLLVPPPPTVDRPTSRPAMITARDRRGSEGLEGTLAATLVLAVAPSTGRFQPVAAVGDQVEPLAVLGHVTGGRGRADALAVPAGGTLRALLVRPGQRVKRGDPLIWIERDASIEGMIAA